MVRDLERQRQRKRKRERERKVKEREREGGRERERKCFQFRETSGGAILCTKANMREPQICFVQVSHFKLGCFAIMKEVQTQGCTYKAKNLAQVLSCQVSLSMAH